MAGLRANWLKARCEAGSAGLAVVFEVGVVMPRLSGPTPMPLVLADVFCFERY